MTSWHQALHALTGTHGVVFRGEVLEELAAARGWHDRPLAVHVPGFRRCASAELPACGGGHWPAVSITGGDCELNCDHCRAGILAPMHPARTPAELAALVPRLVAQGAQGMLLTGGSNRRNEVEYGPYLPVIRRLKNRFPAFRIACHTALMDPPAAAALARAGVDVAMLDVIGAQDTVSQVYHLKRPVADFERALAALGQTSMRVVPHIVLGLHYGRLLGEWEALEMVARQRADALVLVAVMPAFAGAARPFATPDPHAAARFFLDARRRLPGLPLLLGCARPHGAAKVMMDAYAVLAGLDGIAHPSEGVLELARALGRPLTLDGGCCAAGAARLPLAEAVP